MPPQRLNINTKGLKTERTHEENQERAYIAASRRSDRSLEARIESARRASEIHKKRTGRALRVTEQDVINEEMYEEEDDDLQSQYRRLQAHLGTSADVFNGRLNAWVLSHYGARQMAMAAQNGMAFNPHMMNMNMQPPTTPFFAYQPQSQSPTGGISPGMTQRNQSYRQSPYPQQHPRMHDGRSHSISSMPEHQGQQGMMENSAEAQMFMHQRRHSMATPQGDGHSVPSTPQPQGDMNRPPMSRTNSGVQPGHPGHPAFFADQQFDRVTSPQFQFSGYPTSTSSFDPLAGQMQSSISPLTTSLPVEAQQVIGTSFDPTSPFTPMFMNMSHGQPVPAGINYTYRPNFGSSDLKSTSEGINQTLSPNPMNAPGKIDTNVDNLNTPAMTDGSITSPDSVHPQYTTNTTFDGFGLGMNFDKTPSATGSTNTPDGFFNEWVETAPTAGEELTQ